MVRTVSPPTLDRYIRRGHLVRASYRQEHTVAVLKLISLQCIRKHDVTGDDEPIIRVDGNAVWNGVMGKGDTETLTGGRSNEVSFDGTVMVRLYERSGLLEKFIGGGIFVDDDPNNNGLAVFKNSGTHYELQYRVVS